MKTRRLISFLLLALSGFCISGLLAHAQDVFLVCENDFYPPLSNFNFPIFPQVCNVPITILTNANSTPGVHSVTVVNSDTGNNVAVYYFNIGTGGAVTPNYGATITEDYGQIPSGTPPNLYLNTVTGTFTFSGDNFPLWAWPDDPNWKAPAVTDHRQFNLDQVLGWTPTPATSQKLTIRSDYHYTKWAWISFLGYEGPYLPGASAAPPVSKPIVFDLRGPPTSVPPTVGQAANQPFFCSACTTCKGMAVASLDRFQAGIAITDTPISYTPGVGMNMGFTVSYHQRQTNQPATFNFSNLGQQWNGSWISYISGGPTGGQTDAVYHATDGSQYTYGAYERTVAQGLSATAINQGDFQGTEAWTHATLHYRQNPERYERWLPDGTVEVYSQVAGTSATNRLFFLTLITDPQGNTTTLAYDPTAAANGQAMLTSVTDPVGGKLNFGYDTADPLLITQVTRSNDGLSAKFQYTNGELSSITDPIGITSSFQYASGTAFINQMTTPYGTTTFNSSDTASSLEADMTNPLGQTERVEYQESLTGSLVAASDASAPATTGTLTIDNSNLNQANSFYWSRRAISDATTGSISTDSAGFYALAEVTHWAETSQGSIPVPLSVKKPLEGRVWYNYPGQSNVDYVITNASGASTSPSATARLVETGSGTTTVTQASFATYNANGMITQGIDPVGRTTNYTYASNGTDLLTVQQVNGAGQDTLSTVTYNSQHEPLTTVDASGQTTTMAYFANGQLETRTDAQSHVTTLAYNGSGYLSSVTGPVSGATTSYTYDTSGRVHTVTDSEGYVLTMAYDNLDRPVSTTYPDSTTDQTVYNKLDVAETIDRQGRVTSNLYDAIRELLQTTDPLGRTTKYTWCTCGGLSTLTDANGHVTTWGLDEQGRVTSKTYADSTAINYVYETNSGRLHTMTDANSSVASYVYNADNTLSGTSYATTGSVVSTPSVGFSYDTVYNRVIGMTDGTGTTTYSYNAITGSVTTGAGRLHAVVVPIASSTGTVSYSYDEVGRVTNRSIDSSTVTTTFDSLGRVTGVSNPLGAFTYAYVDTTSRLSSVTYPSGTGLSTSYSYFGNTGDQRLETIQNLKSGTTNISRFDYTYNAVGTIATWNQTADTGSTVVNTLAYDNADQLTGAVQSGGGSASNSYNYDPAGNRLASTTGTVTIGGQFNNLNQLKAIGTGTIQNVAGYTSGTISSVTVNAVTGTVTGNTNFNAYVFLPTGTNVVSVVAQPTTGTITTQRYQIVTTGSSTTSLSYDLNGNVLTDENGNTYTWDALNRLKAIVYTTGTYSGTHTEFAYDGLSRRTQIIERAGTTIGSGSITSTKNYLWVGSEMAEERDASNTVQKRFYPQGEQQSGTAYYYTSDHLGSTREMCDGSGNLLTRYQYDPYGRVTTTYVSGTHNATFQYANYYAHQPSGLNLTKFRAYDPSDGRWLSRDPLAEKGGMNLYEYVGDQPELYFDPLGLKKCCCEEALAEKAAIISAAQAWNKTSPVWQKTTNECEEQAENLLNAIAMKAKYHCWAGSVIGGGKWVWPWRKEQGGQVFLHHVVLFSPDNVDVKCHLSMFTLDGFKGTWWYLQGHNADGNVNEGTWDDFNNSHPYSDMGGQ